MGYSPWGHKELDTTLLSLSLSRGSSPPRHQIEVSALLEDSLSSEPPGNPGFEYCHTKIQVKIIAVETLTEFYNSRCSCPVAYSCLILCDALDCSKLDLSVPQYLLKFAQVHVHCIDDAIQPSHLLMPSSSALNLSQHQGPSQ